MDSDPIFGVVGTSDIDETVTEVGAKPVVGDVESVIAADPDYLIAEGDDELIDIVRRTVDAPLLAVNASSGVPTVDRDALEPTLDAILSGTDSRETRQLLSVSIGETSLGPALYDVLLITAEPARIGEYVVDVGTTQKRYRADGILTTTPAGSFGYGRAAGGPVICPGTTTVGIIPIAPFEANPVNVVTASDTVSVRAERPERVEIIMDGTYRSDLTQEERLIVERGPTLEMVRAHDSAPDSRLEKH